MPASILKPTLATLNGRHQKFLDIYCKISKDYDNLGKDSGSKLFTELLRTKYPKVLTKLEATHCRVSLAALFNKCFPNPLCAYCQKSVPKDRPLRSITCSKQCTNLYKYGVSNSSAAESVKIQHKNTMRERHGGYPFEFKIVQRKIKKVFLKRHGVSNPGQLESVRKKMRDTNLRKRGVEYPMPCKEVQSKFKTTMLERYGVEYSMQSPELQKKAALSGFSVKKLVVGKKTFQYQGYEWWLIKRLAKKFGTKNILDQFDPEFPHIFKEVGTHLDIYNKVTGTYVEVKSEWTLLSCLDANRRKAKNCRNHQVRWVIVYPKKDSCVVLPIQWYSWSERKLKNYIISKLS